MAEADTLGESPVWDWRSGRLLWCDIKRGRIRGLDPATGETWAVAAPDQVGAIGLRRGGGLVVALRHALAAWTPRDGFRELVAIEADVPGNRTNDGRVDRQGRFWIGTMSNDTREPTGALYVWDGVVLRRVRDGIIVPNCLAWSPDSSRMYFADSWAGPIEAAPFDAAAGTMGPPRPLLAAGRLPGVADGGTVDRDGALWNARYGGGQVARIRPDGSVDRVVALPVAQVTACALGGPDLRTLYVTSATQRMTAADLAREPLAGAVFAVRVEVPGLPEPEHAPA